MKPQTVKEWFASRQHHWKRAFISLGIIISIIQFLRIIRSTPGDFPLHWKSGEMLATGEFLYTANHNYPYPPFWGYVHSILADIPMQTAYLLIYPLFFIALGLLIWCLDRLCEKHFPLKRNLFFWTTVIAIVLSSRYLVRDMLECGVNLALVALSWLSVYLWREKREFLGSLFLGFAMALKCTPSLFWAYFILKREWKMAAFTFVAAVFFTLSPMFKLGYTEYKVTLLHWSNNVLTGLQETDPSRGIAGEVPLSNMSLKPTLARFVMHLPPEHNARIDSPLYIDFLDFSPQTAGRIVKFTMLFCLALVAWTFRKRIQDREDERVLWECGAISALILLYSPVTWGQHCVGIFPGIYLLTRSSVSHQQISTQLKTSIGVYVFVVLVLNRSFIGKHFTELIDTYHLPTLAFTGIVVFLINRHRQVNQSAQHMIPFTKPESDPGSDNLSKEQRAA
ncbi:MAG: glycosyltransferase family 87 protein [Gimesia sp.]|nr:glycosyltransferase family 87 protein [Gimesia sp.]